MTIEPMPAALREAVSRDLGPVRRLQPPWRRTVLVAGVAAAVLATVLLVLERPLRQDLATLPLWLSWGASLLQLAAGIVVIGLALREAVPGGAAPRGAVRAVALAAFALQMATGVATWLYSPGTPPRPGWLAAGAGCLSHDAAMILPAFAVTLWLVFRALPLRAPAAGLLGGGGAALTGDAVTHLLCPMSDLAHVLVWHTGAVLGFAGLGFLLGTIWERRRTASRGARI
jgi:hypothetical protein